jgi:hypothetical protein
MPYFPNPVVWAGVIVRHEDGTVHAVELDGRTYRIDYEMGWEAEIVEAAPYGWVEAVPTGYETVTVKLSGFGRPWHEGAEHAKPADPTRAIGEGPKEIEA